MPQMQSTTESNSRRNGSLEIALPEPSLAMEQDVEWCVVRVGDKWRRIRFHDYQDVYALPGLYERLFYDILQCDSPATVRRLVEKETRKGGTPAEDLRVLDLGAGNGMVGEEFANIGAKSIVGVDIIAAAAEATERDRPGVYDEYLVTDMANLPEGALGPRSRLIMSYALCGFANFGSLGIMIGGVGTVVPERRADITDMGMESILAGTMATCLTGAVVGIVVP